MNDVSNNNLKFIDLFCGIGGFHQALHKLNCKCVYACDTNKMFKIIIKLDLILILLKLNLIISLILIFCAGFPCLGKKSLMIKEEIIRSFLKEIKTIYVHENVNIS